MKTPSTPHHAPAWLGRTRTIGLFTMWLTLILSIPGCAYFGFMLDSMFPQQIDPVYKLKPVPTVVLVDDLRHQLGDPGLTGVVAERVLHDLINEGVLKPEQVIHYRRVREVETQLGEAYGSTPVDAIGRLTGAQQVIHINIEYMDYGSTPGIIQPSITTAMKVIDPVAGRRVFPADPEVRGLEGLSAPHRGHPVVVSRREMLQPEVLEGDRSILMRDMADRLGREIAKQFYKHPIDKPGMEIR